MKSPGRPAACIWLALPCLNACMVPTGIPRRSQRGFKNFLLISWPAATRFKHPPSLPAIKELTKQLHGDGNPDTRPRAADPEGTGAELSDHDERPESRHEPDQSHLSQLGHSLQRQAGLWLTASGRVAREDPGTRGAPPGGVVLPTAGCAENLAPGSTERSAI